MLRSGEIDRDYPCVVPDLEPEEINDVTATCRLIHARTVRRGTWQELPYAFRYPTGAGVNKDGEVILGTGLGLTCATLVMAIFDAGACRSWTCENGSNAPMMALDVGSFSN